MLTNLHFDEKTQYLFPGNRGANQVHDLSLDDLFQLMAETGFQDEEYTKIINAIVAQRDADVQAGKPTGSGWELGELAVMYSGGAVVAYPNGMRFITFPSKRHLFRGENQKYPATIPSLRRDLDRFTDDREKELNFAVAQLRKWQFSELIWNINIVPYWEAKLSEVNYDALAQHYGFKTCLLDLTSDLKTALFFATCKYKSETDSFLPLTQEDIDKSEETKYGYIFHAPSRQIDFLIGSSLKAMKLTSNANKTCYWQNGDMDGIAFQIGYQPLYRCHYQSGYIYPMRYEKPLQENSVFEKLRFKQSVFLSNHVYEMMDKGKKVFPNEGISEIRSIVDELKYSVVFSREQLDCIFNVIGINRKIFPFYEDLLRAINGFHVKEGVIRIVDGPVTPTIPSDLLKIVNSHYDGKDLLKVIGGFRQTDFDRMIREKRCRELFGTLI